MLLQGFFEIDLSDNFELIAYIIAFFKYGGVGDAEVVQATRELHLHGGGGLWLWLSPVVAEAERSSGRRAREEKTTYCTFVV
jgi:hypothetical protein